MFSGMNSPFWKGRMKIFIESIDSCIWNAIINGPYIPKHVMNGIEKEKLWYKLDEME